MFKSLIKNIIKEQLEKYTMDDAIQDVRKIKQIVEQEENWSFKQIGPRQFHFTYCLAEIFLRQQL